MSKCLKWPKNQESKGLYPWGATWTKTTHANDEYEVQGPFIWRQCRELGGRRLTKARMRIRRGRNSSANVQPNVQPTHISTYVRPITLSFFKKCHRLVLFQLSSLSNIFHSNFGLTDFILVNLYAQLFLIGLMVFRSFLPTWFSNSALH